MDRIIIETAQNIAENNLILAFVFFFVSQSLQILFPPYPGDMMLLVSGYLTGITNINIILIIINAVAATTLSSALLYNIGNRKGEKILRSRLIKRVFSTGEPKRLKNLFLKYGFWVIILSRIIPGTFSISILSSGIFKVDAIKIYLSVFIVASIHHSLLVTLGKALGENWVIILHKINVYNKYLIFIIIAILVGYSVLLMIKRKLLD